MKSSQTFKPQSAGRSTGGVEVLAVKLYSIHKVVIH